MVEENERVEGNEMGIRLIVTDLDGTLLGDDHKGVSRRDREALALARDRGAVVAIASGRTWQALADAAEQIAVAHYAILSNGAALRRADTGEVEPVREILPGCWEPVVRLLWRRGGVFELYAGGRSYIEEGDFLRLGECGLSPGFLEDLRSYNTPSQGVWQQLRGRPIEKINGLYLPEGAQEEVQAAIAQTAGLVRTSSIPGSLELNATGCNKGVALQALCAELGIAPEETMAFGDADNDLEMLRFAHWSFAMENGSAEAKEAARYRTASNAESGVSQAILRHLDEIGAR